MSDTSPATKQDIQLIMAELAKLYDANEGWKDEILTANEGWKDEILTANEEWKDEILREFKVVAETIHYDAVGVTKDKLVAHEERIVDHDDRIVRLEKKAA